MIRAPEGVLIEILESLILACLLYTSYYVHCANAYFGEEKAPLQEGEARYVLDKNQRAVTIELLYR